MNHRPDIEGIEETMKFLSDYLEGTGMTDDIAKMAAWIRHLEAENAKLMKQLEISGCTAARDTQP